MVNKGFTLLEILIVVGILVMAMGLSLPFFSSFQTGTDLRTNNDFLAQSLRLAQIRAITGYQGSNWGIYLDDSQKKFIVYAGLNYASRVDGLDLETSYGQAFSLSADFGEEINFSIFSGLPSVNGTTTFAGPNDDFRYNTINDLGLISIK